MRYNDTKRERKIRIAERYLMKLERRNPDQVFNFENRKYTVNDIRETLHKNSSQSRAMLEVILNAANAQ